MLPRSTLAAVAVVAAAALSAPAADPDLTGNWLISYSPTAATEQHYCIVKIETKGGKPSARVLATPGKGLTFSVREFKVAGDEVTVTLSNGPSFVGTVGSDPKQILGGFGTDQVQYRARMDRTERSSIESAFTRLDVPEEMTEAQRLTTRPSSLRVQAQQEKDAEKRKELLAQVAAAQKEADERVPRLYREVIEKHPAAPAAVDAALNLLRAAARSNVTPDEAARLAALVEKKSAPHGERFTRFQMSQVADALASQKGLEAVAVDVAGKLAKGLTDKDPAEVQIRVLNSYRNALARAGRAAEAKDVEARVGRLELAGAEAAAQKLTDADPPATQVRVLAAYQAALEKAGKPAEARDVAARLEKVEAKLDEEYLAKTPPFKPTPFAGRKDDAANRVAVMELFTGAQCPPCVAADVAFDALVKAYKPTDLVLVQYHVHIPGPDPMTNPDTVARWDYYREKFPDGIRGVPSSVFNGKPGAGGGGGMANAEPKYKQYVGLIDPILETATPVKVAGKATRAGDRIDIAVEVTDADGEELKLRLLLVEEEIRFAGSNGIRFHHHVVRAMPGGAAGVALKDKSLRHSATADVRTIREGLVKYLDDYAANTRPFPQPGRPLDLKNLKVVALVQSDKTGEILQAAQFDVGGKVGAGE
jgi:hypothetical protein